MSHWIDIVLHIGHLLILIIYDIIENKYNGESQKDYYVVTMKFIEEVSIMVLFIFVHTLILVYRVGFDYSITGSLAILTTSLIGYAFDLVIHKFFNSIGV